MKKITLFAFVMICCACTFAAPPHGRGRHGNDGLRTADGILNLVDKALHIFSRHANLPPTVVVTPAPVPIVAAPTPVIAAPAPVPAVTAPAPAIIHHYPDGHHVAPVTAPWHRPEHVPPMPR